MIILTIERTTIHETLSKIVYAFVDTLRGGRLVFEPYIYAVPIIVHLSAASLLQYLWKVPIRKMGLDNAA